MELKLMYTEKGNPFMHAKAQLGLMRQGTNAWQKTWELILGTDKDVLAKHGIAGKIFIPTK